MIKAKREKVKFKGCDEELQAELTCLICALIEDGVIVSADMRKIWRYAKAMSRKRVSG